MSTLLEKLIGSAALKDNPLKCLCIKLKPGSVTTDKIADKAVTPAKLSDSVKTDLIQNPINAVQENLDNHASDTVKHITAQERTTWNSKQDALTFDNLPTQGSNNPVKSNGIYNRMHILTTAIQQVSEDVVTLQQAMPGKQNVLTFDNTPTANSNNPVKSGGVDAAFYTLELQNSTDSVARATELHISLNKNDGSEEDPNTHEIDTLIISQATENKAGLLPAKSKWDDEPITGSSNLVKSGGIKSAIDGVQAVIDSRISYDELDFKKAIVADGHNGIAVKAHSAAGETDGSVEITAENLIIKNTENAHIKLASGSDILFGGIGSITSTTNMTIQAGKDGISTGDLNLNGTTVRINGKDAGSAIEKVAKMYDPSGMGSSDFNIEEEGIYFTKFEIDPLTGATLQYFRCYLLLVGREMRTISSGLATFLDQTLIRLDGKIYKRSIQLPSSGDIDWSTAPNFTEV